MIFQKGAKAFIFNIVIDGIGLGIEGLVLFEYSFRKKVNSLSDREKNIF